MSAGAKGGDGPPRKGEIFTTGVFVRPSRILLVSAAAAEIARVERLLGLDNNSVDAVATPGAALASLKEQKPDLVLLGAALGNRIGFDFCRTLKQTPSLHYIPVVIILDGSAVGGQIDALDCGANDVVREPLDELVFRARIRALLKYKRAVAALRNARNTLEQDVHERIAQLQKEIAEHQRTEAALQESQERYALAAQGSHDGLWDWDLRTDKVFCSERWKSMLGYPEDAPLDSPEAWFAHISPLDLGPFKEALSAHLEGRTLAFSFECRMQHRDRTLRWVHVRGMAVRDKDGAALRIAGSQSDITSRKLMELQLRHDAFHDGLTGLPNRALFMDRLRQAIARMKRDPARAYAVLLLDIDKFKIVNDSLGHGVGDHLLIQFARRVREFGRATDTVARLGGDEFAVLLEDVEDLASATAAAERIHEALKTPLVVHGRQMYATTSIGVATGKPRYERADDVLRDADTALYQAKAAGRGKQRTFASGMHARVLSQMDLEHDLRDAIKTCEQFVLCYQPILALDSGRLVGFEALIRWHHPKRGLVSPLQFIPIAEETDVIGPLTQWVLRTATAQLKAWEAAAGRDLPVYVSVNLSGKTLGDAGLAGTVGEIVRASGVRPAQVSLEITEGSLMKDPEASLATLSCLKAMDIGLMVDDFGTGYSSLSYLHRLPLNILKIDRSFVADIPAVARNMEIVRTIALLADRLGLSLVAEGIETAAQRDWLRSIRCGLGQGHLFSRAVVAAAAYAFMADNLSLQ
ncbi:MAG: EAL domain-containing protein [Planctomycetota bacterium]|nr:EAL domain-containing protein [Planctomycetota bacterium]